MNSQATRLQSDQSPGPPLRQHAGSQVWKPWSSLRAAVRNGILRGFARLLGTDEGRLQVQRTLPISLLGRTFDCLRGADTEQPYPDLFDRTSTSDHILYKPPPIIITGRFRSGSTLLWNLFRNVEGCTAYYEPLNERRWFDPGQRGDRVDGTHRGVSDYWREYDGLVQLGQFYHEDWIRRDLWLSEHAWDWNLKRYIDALIAHAPDRAVLQFNRVDFRLPWLRRHYPHAAFLHIYRHPRDQWCSTLMGDLKRVPLDLKMADFEPFDRFYLRTWVTDLKYQFPFLDERSSEHPYRQFYYLWKLSYLFGRTYCDHSIQFERLVESPDEELEAIMKAARIEDYDVARLKPLIERPALGRWREYAEASWFADHEAACEEVLATFLIRHPDQHPAILTNASP